MTILFTVQVMDISVSCNPCADVDECTDTLNNCHQNATCMNTDGSFTCSCDSGFSGDGVSCTDIDECVNGDNDCDIPLRANCTNLEGSYDCYCRTGYTGDGRNCTGKSKSSSSQLKMAHVTINFMTVILSRYGDCVCVVI